MPFTLTESCDGPDLGNTTCVSLGFQGGELGCEPNCYFATNRCITCVADTHVLDCRHAAVDAADASWLAVAADDEGIVVAWGGRYTDSSEPTASQVYVARFGPDLSPVGPTRSVAAADVESIALARSPSGYLLAVGTNGPGGAGIVLQPLDKQGAVRGTARTIADMGTPVLVAREAGGVVTGGPLLAVSGPRTKATGSVGTLAGLLRDDGTEETPLVDVFSPDESNGPGATVFTGDGFLISGDATTARIGLDGLVTDKKLLPFRAGFVTLAWTGTEVRAVYEEIASPPTPPSGLGIQWMRLDARGNPLAPPVLVVSGREPVASSIFTLGEDSLILLSEDDIPGGLSLFFQVMRVSPTGKTLSGPYDVVRDPEMVLAYTARWVRRGSEAILAWIGGSGNRPLEHIGLARLNP
jgi:hypothetical protein